MTLINVKICEVEQNFGVHSRYCIGASLSAVSLSSIPFHILQHLDHLRWSAVIKRAGEQFGRVIVMNIIDEHLNAVRRYISYKKTFSKWGITFTLVRRIANGAMPWFLFQ